MIPKTRAILQLASTTLEKGFSSVQQVIQSA